MLPLVCSVILKTLSSFIVRQGLSCTLRMDISPVIRGYRCRVEYAFTKGKLLLSSNTMKCRWMNLAHFRLDISLITYI